MKTVWIVMTASLLAAAGGCDNADSAEKALWEQSKELRLENDELSLQIEQLEAGNKTLKQQVKMLSGLDADLRLANLVKVERIEIASRTNFYDKDADGTKEKLIVYVKPIDETGDVIKAAGTFDVQLWDLDRQADQALLGQWKIKADQLKKLWASTLMGSCYRLSFEAVEKISEKQQALTVKVNFTEYLTGRVFKEQKVISRP